MITCFLIPLTSLIYWSTPPHVGKLGREAWAWFKANGRAHGVLFWGTSLLGGGRAGPAPECGSLMPRSRTRSVRVLVKKRRGNVAKMTPGGVTHMFKLDPLGRPSTWPRGIISTHLTRAYVWHYCPRPINHATQELPFMGFISQHCRNMREHTTEMEGVSKRHVKPRGDKCTVNIVHWLNNQTCAT